MKLYDLLRFLMAYMFHTPHVDPNDVVSVGTPPTLTSMGAAALQRVMYDKKLNEPITALDDPWVRGELTNVIEMKNYRIEVPQDIFFQLPTDPSNPHTIRCQAFLPLQEAPQEGTAESMPGNEEGLRLMYTNFYYNQIMKAVKRQGWGIEYEDVNGTGAFKMINPLMRRFLAEYKGVRIRKASMLQVEDALTKAPISLTQNLCPNIFICNIEPTDMPVWDLTPPTVVPGSEDSLGYYPDKTFGGGDLTYIEAVCDKMIEASGIGSSPVADMRIDDIDRLWYYLTQIVKMPKCRIPGVGTTGYLCMMHQEIYDNITSLANDDGFKGYFQAVNYQTGMDIMYTGKLLRYRDIFFASDPRGPTLTLGGSDGSWTLQPGFYNPGDNDDRNNDPWSATSGSVNYVYPVFFVYGAGALAERVVVPTQYVNEVQAYGYLRGRGSYTLGGIATPMWDIDTPDDDNNSNYTFLGKTLEMRSLVMGICSRTSIGGSLRATS